MAIDYEAIRLKASLAIRKAGKPATLRIFTQGGIYDPATGANGNTYVDYLNVWIVTPPATGDKIQAFDVKEENYDEKHIRFAKMEAEGLVAPPKLGDLFSFDGGWWRIAGITPVRPATVVIIYNLGLRSVPDPGA